MVWLISFLTVSNIALGYGLAVYFDRHFGTALPTCGRLSLKRPHHAGSAAAAPTEAPAPNVPPSKASAPEVQETGSIEIESPQSVAAAEQATGLPPVDEENVLAGIEEFRSQLAKMNVSTDAGAEPEDAAAEAESVVAAN